MRCTHRFVQPSVSEFSCFRVSAKAGTHRKQIAAPFKKQHICVTAMSWGTRGCAYIFCLTSPCRDTGLQRPISISQRNGEVKKDRAGNYEIMNQEYKHKNALRIGPNSISKLRKVRLIPNALKPAGLNKSTYRSTGRRSPPVSFPPAIWRLLGQFSSAHNQSSPDKKPELNQGRSAGAADTSS